MSKSNIKKLVPVPFDPITNQNDPQYNSVKNQLERMGHKQFPNTKFSVMPVKDPRTKRYLTGLDVDAISIKNIEDTEVREAEIKRITTLKAELERLTGLNLDPITTDPSRPCYYELISRSSTDDLPLGFVFNNPSVGEVFDLSSPMKQIDFLWLCETPFVLKSFIEYERGYNAYARYIVEDIEAENKVKADKYKIKMDATTGLNAFYNSSKVDKLATLLNIPYAYDDSQDVILAYVAEYLDGITNSYITDDLKQFVKFTKLSPEQLDANYFATLFIRESIVTEQYGGIIREGVDEYGERLSESGKQGLVEYLLDAKNSEKYAMLRGALEEAIQSKYGVRVSTKIQKRSKAV